MDDENVNKRLDKYFEDLLIVVGNERRMSFCERFNDKIRYDEVWGAVKKLKGSKLPGCNEIAVEYLKKRIYVMELMVRMFNGCMREGVKECISSSFV